MYHLYDRMCSGRCIASAIPTIPSALCTMNDVARCRCRRVALTVLDLSTRPQPEPAGLAVYLYLRPRKLDCWYPPTPTPPILLTLSFRSVPGTSCSIYTDTSHPLTRYSVVDCDGRCQMATATTTWDIFACGMYSSIGSSSISPDVLFPLWCPYKCDKSTA